MVNTKVAESLSQVIDNNSNDKIVVIWASEETANYCRKSIDSNYLNRVREYSEKRQIEYPVEINHDRHLNVLTCPHEVPISIGVTVEALKNSKFFFNAVSFFCGKYDLSYIEILN